MQPAQERVHFSVNCFSFPFVCVFASVSTCHQLLLWLSSQPLRDDELCFYLFMRFTQFFSMNMIIAALRAMIRPLTYSRISIFSRRFVVMIIYLIIK